MLEDDDNLDEDQLVFVTYCTHMRRRLIDRIPGSHYLII